MVERKLYLLGSRETTFRKKRGFGISSGVTQGLFMELCERSMVLVFKYVVRKTGKNIDTDARV